MSFKNFPVIETPRLILRKATVDDGPDIFEMRSDPEVMKFIPRPLAKTLQDAIDVILLINDFIRKAEKINWAIELKSANKVIGLIGFVNIYPEHYRAETGYSLNRQWHRKGIASEALTAILHYGFTEMNLHSVLAIVDEQNVASASLLLKTGFRKEGLFKEDFLFNGVFRNSLYFGMLRSDWELKGED